MLDHFSIEPIPRVFYLQLLFWVKYQYFLWKKLSRSAPLCEKVDNVLPLLNFLTCDFQSWISKSTAVCLSRKELHLSCTSCGDLLSGLHWRSWKGWEKDVIGECRSWHWSLGESKGLVKEILRMPIESWCFRSEQRLSCTHAFCTWVSVGTTVTVWWKQ